MVPPDAAVRKERQKVGRPPRAALYLKSHGTTDQVNSLPLNTGRRDSPLGVTDGIVHACHVASY